MASRAGFVIMRNGVAKCYGSRLAGSSTVSWLLAGPEKATEAFVLQGEMDELDDILGGEDGAALIDWDNKVVLWMMANCHLPVQQRLCNRMIGQVFQGWNVRVVDDLYEIAQYAGCDLSKYSHDEMEDYADDLDEEERREIVEEQEQVDANGPFHEDDFYDPPASFKIGDALEDIRSGQWVSIRMDDGSWKDYFGSIDLQAYGPSVVKHFAKGNAIDRVPPELATTGGAIIDLKEKTYWRWAGFRGGPHESYLARQWNGWTLKDLSDGWQSQVEATGREAGDLACDDRSILAAMVQELAPFTFGEDDDDGVPNLGKVVAYVRIGCAGITALFALIGVLVYAMTQSVGGTVFFGCLFLACLFVTRVVFKKTGALTQMLGPIEDPKVVKERISRILVGLGYPAIDELKASGEFAAWERDEDEER